MPTVAEFITRALRRIRVLRKGQAATADQLAQGIETLNELMEQWATDGVDLGYAPVTEGADDLPLPDWALNAVRANLAINLAPDFNAPLDPRLVAIAESGRLYLERVTQRVLECAPANLPSGAGNRSFDDFDFG